MSPEAQECLSQSVAANQGADGFFCGRAGQEDLYYTFFGLLLAAVTNTKIRRKDCAAKLKTVDFATLDLVHACAWWRAMKLLQLRAMPFSLSVLCEIFVNFAVKIFTTKYPKAAQSYDIASLTTLPPHAYPQQDADSPYSCFLLGTLHTDFGRAMPKSDLDAYRLPNGLYANLKHHANYGINATAAALFLIPKESCDETANVLLALQEPDGSYKAAASAPEGDLMSTATAAFALQRCGQGSNATRNPTLRISPRPFLRECFRDNGLFAATPLDPDGDLEYTAYGLLLMGLLT